MNKNQLESICQTLNIHYPDEWPKRIYGGLLHNMWCLDSHGSKFAVKQLNAKIPLTEKVKSEYELTEDIAFQFSQQGIPAIHAIKAQHHYLILAEERAFLAYPWIAGKALHKDTISEMHAVKMATILAKIHRINLNVPELDAQKFDVHANEQIISLIEQSVSQNLIFKAQLKDSQTMIIEMNDHYQNAIPILRESSVVSHGDLDQKNVLWDEQGSPFLIDWESARQLNPTYDIINCALDWSGMTTSTFNKPLFIKMLKTYASTGATLNKYHLDAALYGVLGNWLNWLFYNIERSFSSDKAQHDLGAEQVLQVLPTLFRIQANSRELTRCITKEL